METVDFGTALANLKAGNKVQRDGWNGPGQYIELQKVDESVGYPGKMTLSYIYIKTVRGDLVPWVASQTDLLADDWRIYV